MLAVCILMRGRDEINNGFPAGASFSLSLAPRVSRAPNFPLSLPHSSACHASYEMPLDAYSQREVYKQRETEMDMRKKDGKQLQGPKLHRQFGRTDKVTDFM